MSSVHLRNIGVPRNQPVDRTGVSRSKRPGSGQHDEWKDPQGDYSHTLIHLTTQQKPKNRGLDRYGSSTSAPPTPQRPVPMEHRKKRLKLTSRWVELGEGFHNICLR
ncbi:hypothetical protein O181_002991 [Austropuccinia psidii MF-1]|uniref:Uncharacterized protein n=1 Tax=Austropuccinia psidii MF-1 TaxID=1389203 RepID=A0A9Q3BCY9_9BASI|nr:hypothetical protein [Austropuccinia psidii MF-1]